MVRRPSKLDKLFPLFLTLEFLNVSESQFLHGSNNVNFEKNLDLSVVVKSSALNRYMDWTDSCQRGRRGTGRKVKGLAKEHVCMARGHGQQCGDGQREG